MDDLLNRIANSLREGDNAQVSTLTREAVDRKVPSKEILDKGLIAGMNEVGELFKNHDIFLPDVLLAAKAMYAGLEVLKPLLLRKTFNRSAR